MRFVHNYQIGNIIQEHSSVLIAFNEIDTDDKVAVILVNTYIASGELSFQPGDASRLNYRGIKVEFFSEFFCPLVT